MEPWETADLAVLDKINRDWTHPVLDSFFVWLTKPPHEELYFVAAALALILFGGRRGRMAVPWIALAVLLADQISASVLKPWIDRMRPCFAHPDQVLLLMERQARSPSFPSSHAANSFAVALVLFGVHRRLGWAMLGLAFLISYSRPYVGVHYPSDILVGALLGLALGGCCRLLQVRFEQWRAARRASRGASGEVSSAVSRGDTVQDGRQRREVPLPDERPRAGTQRPDAPGDEASDPIEME